MRIFWILGLSLALVLNFIGLSSEFECLPNGEPIPAFPHGRPLAFRPPRRDSPEESLSPARNDSSARFLSPAGTSLPVRNRSPSSKQNLTHVLGYALDDLRFVRLIPCSDLTQRFQLRRYVFPQDKPIRLRSRNRDLLPLPTDEQIVLTLPSGDVCAIWEKSATSNKKKIFRGLYKPVFMGSLRAKINIDSGLVTDLTPEEIKYCPVGQQSTVLKNFRILHL